MPKFSCILFPVDFSERSIAAAPFVLSMALRSSAKVVLLHAIEAPPPPAYGGMGTIYPETYDFPDVQAEVLARLKEFAESQLPKCDVECIAPIGDPATVIEETADSMHADLIAMPTHGYGGFRRFLLGSVTAKVLHDSKTPVWTAAHAPEPSHRAHPKPRHILVSLDMKSEGRHTLEYALELAAASNATVEIVHAAPEGDVNPDARKVWLNEVLVHVAESQALKVDENKAAAPEIVNNGGSVADLVRDIVSRKRIDLVVIGRGCIGSLLGRMRTNAYEIIREAPCPVLSV